MCGRYACRIQPLGRWSAVFRVWIEGLADRYNIAPATDVAVFSTSGWRWMRWGLIPAWAKEPSSKYSTFNARAESLSEKPAFRDAWREGQRCLIPALGYYEWRKGDGGEKVPYFIHSQKQEPLVFAGLWDCWHRGEQELFSCTVVTVEARGPLRELHHRMPLMLEPKQGRVWLDGRVQEAGEILEAPKPVAVGFYPVDNGVGNVRNQGENLIQPRKG